MNGHDDPTLDDELIAYLDGELEMDAARRVEQRLTADPELRRRLNQHQQAWDFLDELPRAHVDPRFTRTTVELVAVKAAEELSESRQKPTAERAAAWLLVGAVIVLSCWSGYFLVWSAVSAPNRQLVDDLPLIENLDAYRHAEDIEFLRALQREGLFSLEVGDEP